MLILGVLGVRLDAQGADLFAGDGLLRMRQRRRAFDACQGCKAPRDPQSSLKFWRSNGSFLFSSWFLDQVHRHC